jgi:hypothetical protein
MEAMTIDGRTVETLEGSRESSTRVLWCYDENDSDAVAFALVVAFDWSSRRWTLESVRECVRFDAEYNELPCKDDQQARDWFACCEDELNVAIGVPEYRHGSSPDSHVLSGFGPQSWCRI